MRILHVISQTPDYTGSGKYIQEIIRQSSQNGHDNFLVAGAQADFVMDHALIPKAHTRFVRFDGEDIACAVPGMSDAMPYKSTIFSRMPQPLLEQYKNVFDSRIKAALDRFKPDIVHTHHLWIVTAVTRQAAPHLPVVTSCHGTCLRQHTLCGTIGAELSPTLRKIDQVMALSSHQETEIQQVHGIDPSRIHAVGIGYNNDLFSMMPKPLFSKIEIVYAGKLSRAKGVPWLLRALEQVQDQDVILHVAGDGAGMEKEECLALGKALGDRVIFHGALPHDKLARLMQQAHLFVLPSFYEGMPLVIMEALACGCRVISTALPGIKELLSGKETHLIDLVELPELETIDTPYDRDLPVLEERLSTAIKKMLESIRTHPEVEPGIITRLTRGYSWDSVYKRIETVYETALSAY